MRAYAQLLVKTCHKRGAFAIGGMAAFIPNRRDEEVNARALTKVREDKQREAGDGFDGSWVAHPDLVPVCREVFDEVLGDRPNQLDRQRDDVQVRAADLLDLAATPGSITREGLRENVEVALLYLEAWLRGLGAVGIHNLMEDAATAEISRSQIWQWVHNGSKLEDGTVVTADLVRHVLDQELARILAEQDFPGSRFPLARRIFEEVSLADDFADFLTLPAYDAVVAS
jgi:malate synthase